MAKANSQEKLKVLKGGVEYEIEHAEEGGYIASVPLYPSCVSQGESLEETLGNIEDALLGCLAAAEELDLPIPKELQLLLRQKVKP